MLDVEEYSDDTRCGSCGAVIFEDDERNFAYSSTGALCWDCARARGGVWDGLTEHWARAPEVADLLPPYDD